MGAERLIAGGVFTLVGLLFLVFRRQITASNERLMQAFWRREWKPGEHEFNVGIIVVGGAVMCLLGLAILVGAIPASSS